MQTDHLKIFIDLAETLNFTQTSQNMHVTQPMVTQVIHSLENELNTVLFNRDKRHVRLTESGETFYEDIKPLIFRIELSVERIRFINERKNNSFTIGYTGTFFETQSLPKIISAFKKLHPQIKIYLKNFNYNILKKDLLNDECDVIFQTIDSIDKVSELKFTPLKQGQFVCIIPKDHLLSHAKIINLTDLMHENIILLNANQCPPKQLRVQRWLETNCSNAIFSYSDSIMLSHTMVQGGLGISVMPDFVTMKRQSDFRVVPLNYQEDLIYGLASLIYSKNELVHEFITCAIRYSSTNI
ncbi:MAG: LysR family transcriptional regulator [Leuconostoc gelidum]|jgi:LysR family hca operon transcriptional activator|uniref:LysR family transcriptional regulator n=1 Tax=Leuconostoc gelidum TaxID=1244 RepID=UPI0002191F7B|nr:LysR family transcriptional regulator [Leuconostoc gelidum]AFS41146.1 HTH-type transcriptional regulator alsr (als operon regulatoryprotein) [Leuconostoc gelidum JB7]MBZ5978792.1 LysR family transcriptional regulator [Leuconostoc gelidum subsp. gelidum]MBZ5992601.1 LysR family transcriptional regulator [Leuconostoc gelidum subsp. gelidum]MBZ6001802.1 LysR family transcriptional regulator [Leuconostoc gelidum subsp. gelidum]MBZ6009153.1 LysR family transcriptional regulator [Leuconostoc geli